ncbi:MAG: multidrug ABC transporter ATP-binding protein [Flavobacteriales bacterium]|nr:MAG: multidrug ABC transporter ATP-binding protein [Flavobacteriales bacterium]
MSRHKDNDSASPKGKINKHSLKKSLRLLVFIKPYRGAFAIGLLFLLLSSLASLAFPKLTGDLVDADKLENIHRIGLILMGIFLANAFFSYFRIYLFEYVTQHMLAELRTATYSHLIKLPMTFFSSRRVGELNSRIAADISLLQSTFTTTIAEFLRQIVIIIGGMIMLSMISFRLTIFMICVIPVLALVAVFFGKFIRKLSKDAQSKVAESNTIVEETLQGISNVKAFTNESFEIGRYSKSMQEIIGISLKAARYRGAFASFIIFCLFGGIVGVIWYGIVLREQGELTDGLLISFVLYTVFLGASTAGIADLYSQIQKAVGSTEHLLEILDEKPEIIEVERKDVLPHEKIIGHVQFGNVSFSYPARKEMGVIKNISFEAKSGERVAIVGPSGAGKSTIVSLLLRFYDADSGEIVIDGKNIKDFSLTHLRSIIAVVPQDILLFGGSIRENIAYGKPTASEEEIMAAAEKANAKEFIESFPDKFDTIVGERGIQLSGGQRQRIAIARAVLKNPSILILDEATSSLDSESERQVQEALEKLLQNRTSFVIAHRLSTVRNADKILVLDNGELKEAGTHSELMRREDGLYKSLSQLQLELA